MLRLPRVSSRRPGARLGAIGPVHYRLRHPTPRPPILLRRLLLAGGSLSLLAPAPAPALQNLAPVGSTVQRAPPPPQRLMGQCPSSNPTQTRMSAHPAPRSTSTQPGWMVEAVGPAADDGEGPASDSGAVSAAASGRSGGGGKDPFDLTRFVTKHDLHFGSALKEIRHGRKQSCWSWCVQHQHHLVMCVH